ncbi:hypothetical protein NET03_05285 [Thermomicrobium sp. CFH 73360]|uniref:hypothetical protein n=1 Tax=Thermomicrobium sp. CFH 73360 TaxID=2951987 RepID=UPI0020771470|nr:hypothetical protein [Thermomicrobium sp. CFH 73360]MCM8745938.1 hypothetical protein [Thermomicrobium sp. CFH 73360]
MREFFLAPCRIGWLLVTVVLVAYGITTGQWTVLLAAAAPAAGAFIAWFAGRRMPACSLPDTPQGKGTSRD